MSVTREAGSRMPPDATRLASGVRLGPYEILGFVGAGAMGEVYRAHDSNLNRVVALKLLPTDLAGDQDRLRRFADEARAASALTHPSIVTIYDAGQIGSRGFISMELVEGATLREILAAGPVPLRRALQIGAQLADGLSRAHEAGIVHRDLKPDNIKVSDDGLAKILDFGLAKRVRPSLAGALAKTQTALETSPGLVVGTVGYMSPEQASGEPAGFSSDQFSFGTILYEMLTGRRAFEKPTLPETLSAIIRDEPWPIANLNPAVPPPVRWIVERCLSKEPAERYAMTRDLSRDLSSARDHLTELVRSRAGRIARRVAQGTSLAVLPVIDLSPGAPQDVVAETMTDALITELAQRSGLRVVSKLSTMACKGRRGALADLAEELGVEWVVLASIARIGREVRITAQLVECGTDENRWAHSYTRPARRILSLESEVAAAIAQDVEAAIHLRLGERHDRPDVSPVQRVAVSAA